MHVHVQFGCALQLCKIDHSVFLKAEKLAFGVIYTESKDKVRLWCNILSTCRGGRVWDIYQIKRKLWHSQWQSSTHISVAKVRCENTITNSPELKYIAFFIKLYFLSFTGAFTKNVIYWDRGFFAQCYGVLSYSLVKINVAQDRFKMSQDCLTPTIESQSKGQWICKQMGISFPSETQHRYPVVYLSFRSPSLSKPQKTKASHAMSHAQRKRVHPVYCVLLGGLKNTPLSGFSKLTIVPLKGNKNFPMTRHRPAVQNNKVVFSQQPKCITTKSSTTATKPQKCFTSTRWTGICILVRIYKPCRFAITVKIHTGTHKAQKHLQLVLCLEIIEWFLKWVSKQPWEALKEWVTITHSTFNQVSSKKL